MSERPIDAERLAALLDGRLDPAERAEVVARLAASDEALGFAADAAAVARELEEEEDARAGVVPLRPRAARRFGVRPWMAAAAAVAALVLLPLGLWMGRSGGPPAPVAVVAMLDAPSAGLPVGWDVRPWAIVRGEGDVAVGRLGAFLVDLDVAARARDPVVAVLAARVASVMDGVPGGGTTADRYRAIAPRAGEEYAALAPALREGEEAVAGLVDSELLAVGAWAEAARFAAMRRDAEFFRDRGSRRMMERAEARLGAEGGAAVARMRAGLDGGATDWSEVQSGAEGVLRELR